MLDNEYRHGVYALIIKDGISVLLVQKVSNGLWDFPGGGIEEGESTEQAARREIKEELGVTNIELVTISSITNKYLWNEHEVEEHFNKTNVFKKGQEQFFVILRLTDDYSITLQTEELLDYKWVSLLELANHMSYPDQLKVVQKVLAEAGIYF